MTTDEERAQLLERLAEQAKALATSTGWQRWLAVASRMRTYSLHNQLLICLQRPEATVVAGYRAWQSVGRQVRRGEHGIAIFAPTTRKVTAEDEPQEAKRVLTGFRLVRVFDISQTDGEALPGYDLLSVRVPSDVLFDRLLVVVRQTGQAVDFVDTTDSSARGWFVSGQITLVASYSPSSRTRTLLHELAHAADARLPVRPRSAAELVAEAAAYIVGTGLLGLEMDDASAAYVTGWADRPDDLVALAAQIVAVAQSVEALVAPAIAAEAVSA